MREIKFRGLNFGDVWYYSDKSSLSEFFLLVEAKDSSPVIRKNTVGQYTGLKDKNGKEIYEGDIVRIDGHKHDPLFSGDGYINWVSKNGCYEVRQSSGSGVMLYAYDSYIKDCKVIGNIYESPELIGGTK